MLGSSGYIVSQYIGGQHSSYQRCSWSWNWVYKGFVGDYYRFKDRFFYNPIKNKFYKNHREIDFYLYWDDWVFSVVSGKNCCKDHYVENYSLDEFKCGRF